MAQFARPDSDVTNTGNGGWADVDESSPSDSDYWYGDNNQADTLEVTLTDPSTPLSGTCTVRYRIAKVNAGTLDGGGNAVSITCTALEGSTSLGSDTQVCNGTWTTYTFTFATSAVTDWSNLRIRIETTSSGGSPANRRGGAASWLEIETPNAASPVTVTPSAPTLTLTGYAPTVTATAGVVVTPAAASLTLTGYAPTVSAPRLATPAAAILTLTGYAPAIVAPVTQTPAAAMLTLTGYAPGVVVGGAEIIGGPAPGGYASSAAAGGYASSSTPGGRGVSS